LEESDELDMALKRAVDMNIRYSNVVVNALQEYLGLQELKEKKKAVKA
jgi:hypothetical protein